MKIGRDPRPVRDGGIARHCAWLRRIPVAGLIYLALGGLYAEWGLGHLAAPLARLAAFRLWDYGVAALLLMLVQSLILDRTLHAIARR